MGRGDASNVEGSPTVRAQRDVLLLDDVSVVSLWTPTGAAANLVASTKHVLGQQCLSFDKVGGNTEAAISRTLPRLDGSARFSGSDLVELILSLPTGLTGLDEVVLRIGNSVSNYAEWNFPAGDIHLGAWDRLTAEIAAQDPVLQAGVGMDLASLQFAQVIVRTNSAGQTFVGGILDSLVIRGSN